MVSVLAFNPTIQVRLLKLSVQKKTIRTTEIFSVDKNVILLMVVEFLHLVVAAIFEVNDLTYVDQSISARFRLM